MAAYPYPLGSTLPFSVMYLGDLHAACSQYIL